MKCPNCGLFNPESAERCDCGYDFKSNAMEASYVDGQQHEIGKGPVRAIKRILFTLLAFFLSGVFVAVFKMVIPPSGIAGAIMAIVAVWLIFTAWKWSAKFK
jgi:hypothetical protein